MPRKLFGLTQKLIDRLIFICFVRDRQLIDANLFFSDVQQVVKKSFRKKKEPIWGELKHLFAAMNEGLQETGRDIPEFNGGLFREDDELNGLHIQDAQLSGLIAFVSGYDFQSQLDVNILGHIFEQSISDMEDLQSSIESGSEVITEREKTITGKRKKDGIYYTPDYITQYIVKEAVGGWLDDRRKDIYDGLKITDLPDLDFADYESAGLAPNEKLALHIAFWQRYREVLKTIRVLDPACGSGAFLTQVFDYLWKEWDVLMKEWNKLTRPWKEQLRDMAAAEPFAVYQSGDEWKTKKSIVANNIFGVDLNPESIEITKLSLWLKTANHRETLADLSANIKQGNSLIDDPKIAGDSAFDWSKEFAEIMKAGGFDVVLGNPPYVRAELISDDQGSYFKNQFDVYHPSLDLFGFFYEKAIGILSDNGYLCFISNTFNKTTSSEALRKFILEKAALKTFVDFNQWQVFEGAITYPVILALKKSQVGEYFNFLKLDKNATDGIGNNLLSSHVYQRLSQADLDASNWKFESEAVAQVLEKISENKTLLEKYGKCYRGIITGLNEAFVTEEFNGVEDAEHLKWVYEGKDLQKWHTPLPTKKLIVFKSGWTDETFKTNKKSPSVKEILEGKFVDIFKHLNKFEKEAQARTDQGAHWWELRNCAYYDLFEKPKIVFPNLQNRNKFSFDNTGSFINAPAVFLPTSDLSLLAILNSKLIWFYLIRTCVVRSGGYIEVKPQYFEKIPLREISNKAKQPFITKAEQMIRLHQSISSQSKNFLELLQSNFNFDPNNKLKKWYDLEFGDLIEELEKVGAKIPPKKQGEWLALFKTEREKIRNTRSEIDKTDKEIDQMVYTLYGLTEAEIAIVEKS